MRNTIELDSGEQEISETNFRCRAGQDLSRFDIRLPKIIIPEEQNHFGSPFSSYNICP
jgi:hypothetical protein